MSRKAVNLRKCRPTFGFKPNPNPLVLTEEQKAKRLQRLSQARERYCKELSYTNPDCKSFCIIYPRVCGTVLGES